jgi:tetratricopeptide (TPR) repeat protein
MTSMMQANSYSLRGDHELAIAHYERGLALAEELSSTTDVMQQLCQLATERLRAEDFDGARRTLDRVTRLNEQSGDLESTVLAGFGLVELARRTGDLAGAHAHLDWLAPRLRELSFPVGLAEQWLAVSTAAVLITEGRPERVREYLPDALRQSAQRRDMPDVARAAEAAAALFALEGEWELAAWTLGATKAIRGVFDAGEPELARLAASLVEQLTASTYQAAYDRGASLAKAEAIEQLLARF